MDWHMAARSQLLKQAPRKRPRNDNQEAADWVYGQISDAILEQRLAPGTKLGEEQLGDIFAVSRPVVRRALMRLAYDDVVEIRPHRGAFIASPTVEQARQVFQARRVVEDAIVRACATRAGSQDVARLRQMVATEQEAARAGQRSRWVRLSGEFHLVLADLAGNQPLLRFLRDLVAQTSLIIGLYGRGTASACCQADHERIVAAIAARNGETAASIMRDHLSECEAALHMQDDREKQDLKAIFAHVRRSAGS